MCGLNRIKVGDFDISQSVEIADLKELQDIEKHIITIEKLFDKQPKIELNNKKLELFLNGVQLTQIQSDGIYRIYNKDTFIGIGRINNKLLKRDIVL